MTHTGLFARRQRGKRATQSAYCLVEAGEAHGYVADIRASPCCIHLAAKTAPHTCLIGACLTEGGPLCAGRALLIIVIKEVDRALAPRPFDNKITAGIALHAMSSIKAAEAPHDIIAAI